jgi:putative cell wall-binding protein
VTDTILTRGPLLGAALVLAMILGTVPHAAAATADRLDPPAEHESPYPADPSEPDDARSFAAQPAPRFSARGQRFAPQTVVAVRGADRFATSVAGSRSGWPGGAAAAVLATGETHADALAASVLSGVTRSPLLLTPTARLEPAVAAELQRLSPQVVFVIGQLTFAVEQAVAELGLEVERVGGDDAYRTAFAVAQRAQELGADAGRVLVASGAAFPDALSASALSAGARIPILLVPPTGGAEELRAQVDALGASEVWVVGGTAAVPQETVQGLPGLDRMSGPERTATAARVADRARALGLAGPPVLASAETFPDGLSGGVLAGVSRSGPLLLSARGELSPETAAWVGGAGSGRVDIIGGEGAISELTRCQIGAGDTRALLCIEAELARQGYNTGPTDGRLDGQSVWAFFAFQKVAGLPPSGNFGEAEYRRMLANPRLAPRHLEAGARASGEAVAPAGDHVEIDLARQLVLVVVAGEVRHVLHTATGKPSTPTIRGLFTVYEVRNVRQANRMYRPAFFRGGYAFHGYPEIPLHPASAGCARLYDGDMDFLWRFVQRGARVASY